ncbi:MFS transporter [Conexibacter sp. DBS9H8]|uniref:MFS transporter n=1 Tax=Conexibacter sp. DBS9H8 TaxID=2937801 RepID=UPI00200E2C36|nr:MFS transporter [Conexibacter sp. DBS9H8]
MTVLDSRIPDPTGAPSRRRRLAILAICCLSLLLVALDTSIVNVALPAIHRDLKASLSELQWTLDAYTLVLASLLMLAGSTADRLGRKPVFLTGVVIFTTGSALCALAPSLGFLIAARVLQAVGGSMLNPVALSIIRDVFTDPRERAQAIGVWGAVVGIATALGPVLGGALVDGPGWRFVFLVNVPVGITALILTVLFVPNSRAQRARRPDPVGQGLILVGLGALVFGIIEGARDGWGSPTIVGAFLLALACFGALVPWELRRRDPLLEVRFFRSRPFTGATGTAVAAFAALGGFLFLNTLYLQDARGFSALHAGLYSLPTALMMLFFAPLSGRIVGSRGARVPLVGAGVLITVAPLLFLGLSTHTSTVTLFIAYLLIGVGFGIVNPPITNTAVSGMPPAQSGVAAAVASTGRQVGFALGVAVAGAVTGLGATGQIGRSFATATHPGWAVLSGMGLIVLALGLWSSTAAAQGSAERTAVALGNV